MCNLYETIEHLENLRHVEAATLAEISDAEKALGVRFAGDYRQYLLKYGAISARGVELTGLKVSDRINVVSVTQTERALEELPKEFYIIENLYIEGQVVAQNSHGSIYRCTHGTNKLIAHSLCEYLSGNL